MKMRLVPGLLNCFEAVGSPTKEEKELGARKLAEMLVPGTKAAIFLGFDGDVEKFVLEGQSSQGGSNVTCK